MKSELRLIDGKPNFEIEVYKGRANFKILSSPLNLLLDTKEEKMITSPIFEGVIDLGHANETHIIRFDLSMDDLEHFVKSVSFQIDSIKKNYRKEIHFQRQMLAYL